MAFEREMLYAAKFPFVDYGIDLKLMAEREKGMQLTRLTSKPVDTDKGKKEDRTVIGYLEKLKPRSADKVPEKFVGKGPGGYILYDIVCHRGKSSPKLNRKYQDLVRYYNSPEQDSRISKYMQKRVKIGGFRYAMMGASKRRDGKQRGLKL